MRSGSGATWKRSGAASRLASVLVCAVLALCGSVLGGCTIAPSGATTTSASVDGPVRVPQRGLQYREHHVAGLRVLEVVLGDADFDAELPLVVQIHGRGDRVRVPAGAYTDLRVPMRLLLPEAPKPYRGGFTWSPVSVTQGRTRELAAALRTSASQIVHVIRYFRGIRSVKGEPIVTGFSQGGMLSFTLAVLYPDDVGVALPVAGWLPPPLMPRVAADHGAYPPIHAIHGRGDPVVRIGPTRRSVRRLSSLGLEADLREVEVAKHVVTPEMRAMLQGLLSEAVARAASGRSGS